MKHFYPERSLPEGPSLHPKGTRGHWMVWWVCELCGLRSHQISIQLNTYGRFWTDVFDSALHRRHQNTKWENIFWKNSVHPSSRVQRLSMPKNQCSKNQCQGALKLFWQHVVAQHLTKTLMCVMLVFRWICRLYNHVGGVRRNSFPH